MPIVETLGLIKGFAAPGLIFRLVVSVVGLSTVFALVPGGPNSMYSVIDATATWLGFHSIGSVTAAQAWMQDPARADDITRAAIFGAAVAAWLGVAQDSYARHTRAAPSLVLFVSLAIAAGGALRWGSVAWLLAFLLVSAAIYRRREGDVGPIGAFIVEVALALALAVLAVVALLVGGQGRRPGGQVAGEVQPSAANGEIQQSSAVVVELRPGQQPHRSTPSAR